MTEEGPQTAVFPGISPATYSPHRLHASVRAWPETNCYADLWIEVLATFGVEPESFLGFTVTQDFEGDQFTFFKPPFADLEDLFGIVNAELAIFDDLETQLTLQLGRGRLCQVEVDSFHLPDTRGVDYGIQHGKTTIGVNRLDPAAHTMEYFHNAGYFALSGADYEGVFQHGVQAGLRWIPYVDFAKFTRPPQTADALRPAALRVLQRNLRRRPATNPIRRFAEVFPAQVAAVAERPFGFFHTYAFNTLRQFGANFELLSAHLEWLDAEHFAAETSAAKQIADNAKSTQFLLARAVTRHRFTPLENALQPAVEAWDALFAGLDARA